MKRQQRVKLLSVVLIGILVTGSLGAAASAAEADATVASESVVVSEQSDQVESSEEPGQEASSDTETADAPSSDQAEGTEEEAASENMTTEEAAQEQEETAGQEEQAEDSSQSAKQEELQDEAEESASGEAMSAQTEEDAQAEETQTAETEEKEDAQTESDAELSAEPSTGEEAAEDVQEYEAEITEMELSRASVSVKEGKTTKLTVTAKYECEDLETLTETLNGVSEEDVVWTSSDKSAASISENSSVTASIEESQTEAPYTGVITQEVTVSAVREGSASIVASVGGESETCKITVSPLPKVLETPSNLYWSNTTTLYWNAVEGTNKYKITIYLKKGSSKYSKSLEVSGRTNYDLEDEIVSLIKTNRKYLAGAAYTIWATVQSRSTDTVHYSHGGAGKSPSFRYLRTTYLESLSRNGWFLRNGYWYYYEEGVMQKGWVAFAGERYYLNKDGILQKSCWIGGKYLKSDGAMAKNEWVDGYQYYVGQNGTVVSGVPFSQDNWVKTKAGWRYKTAEGKYVKNTWYTIDHRVYYFDAAGHMVTGWLTLNGNTYYLNNAGDLETGRGTRQSGWKKIGSSYYWFDKNGVMARSQWVDRGQYYVNAAGRRQSWLMYSMLRNVSTSNRLGYYVYKASSPPEQSIVGYELAYQSGNRIMVVDLRFTKDNIPVCFHDDTIKYARWKNGSVPGNKPTISKMTYAQLCNYDYGIYRGKQYKGTTALTLDEMASWIKKHTDAELYIEVKAETMNAAQIRNTAAVLKKYGVVDQSSMIFTVTKTTDTRAKRVHNALSSMRIGITTSYVDTMAYSQLKQAKGSNEVFLWCWDTLGLTSTIVNNLKKLDAPFECGIFYGSFEDIVSYYSKGSAYSYNSGVETPGNVFQSMLRTATYHDQAHWVSTDKGWKYQKVDQTYVKNKWLVLGTKKYYFGSNGLMQTGWLNLNGTLYYLNSDGSMVTGWKVIASKRYYFDANGVMLTGKQVLNGHTYLFDSKGKYIKKIN